MGSTRTQKVDVRFLAATNRDLAADVREGRFREDLYYRLNAITIRLPSLAERPDDILPLFYHFVDQAALKAGRPRPQVSPQLEKALLLYRWPGNVRELENEVKRLIALTPAGSELTADRLTPRVTEAVEAERPEVTSLVDNEKELIELHLRLAGGNRTHAAQSLGITRGGLRKKMLRYGIP